MAAISIAEFIDKIDILYSTGRHAPSTRVRILRVLGDLKGLGCQSTGDLTTDLVARFIRGRGADANPNTTNGLVGVIRSACSIAIEEGWLAKAPTWKRLKLREAPMVRNRPAGYTDTARLLDHLMGRRESWEGHRLCALCWLVALSAVRLKEALCSHREDLDLVARTFRVDARRQRPKTEASAATVALPECLIEVLRGWLPSVEDGPWLFPGTRRRGPWTGGTVVSRALGHLQRAAKEVGIERITWHSLRHGFGTYALEKWDLPIWLVQRTMRHTDPRTTERYLHLDDSPQIAELVRPIGYQAAS